MWIFFSHQFHVFVIQNKYLDFVSSRVGVYALASGMREMLLTSWQRGIQTFMLAAWLADRTFHWLKEDTKHWWTSPLDGNKNKFGSSYRDSTSDWPGNACPLWQDVIFDGYLIGNATSGGFRARKDNRARKGQQCREHVYWLHDHDHDKWKWDQIHTNDSRTCACAHTHMHRIPLLPIPFLNITR